MVVVVNGKRKLTIGKHSFISEERFKLTYTFIFTKNGDLTIKDHRGIIYAKPIWGYATRNGQSIARITFEDFYFTYDLMIPFRSFPRSSSFFLPHSFFSPRSSSSFSLLPFPSFSPSLVCVRQEGGRTKEYVGKEFNFIIEFQ
jgi:hypothetical protein